MDSVPVVLFVLPSMRISGGVLEALRLAGGVRSRGVDARVLVLWRHPNAVDRVEVPGVPPVPIVHLSNRLARKYLAPFDFPFLLSKFWRYLNLVKHHDDSWPSVVTTHYSTLPFGQLVPPGYRYNFLQDEEWLFLPKGIKRQAIKTMVLPAIRRAKVITANSYITERISSRGIAPIGQASIWADEGFAVERLENERPIDLVMVLRYGAIKRLDLYWKLLSILKEACPLRCAVITCEDEIAGQCTGKVDICLLRPASAEMKALFSRSKVFVLLSEREGFGLPPLEAMGTGCVPVCRDSGGVRCYMKGALIPNLFPLNEPMAAIANRIVALLTNTELLHTLACEAKQLFDKGLAQATEERVHAWNLFVPAGAKSRSFSAKEE